MQNEQYLCKEMLFAMCTLFLDAPDYVSQSAIFEHSAEKSTKYDPNYLLKVYLKVPAAVKPQLTF